MKLKYEVVNFVTVHRPAMPGHGRWMWVDDDKESVFYDPHIEYVGYSRCKYPPAETNPRLKFKTAKEAYAVACKTEHGFVIKRRKNGRGVIVSTYRGVKQCG